MNIREMKEKRAQIHEQAKALVPASGSISDENRSKFDSLMSEVETLGADIARLEKLESVETELRSSVTPPLAQVGSVQVNESKEQREQAHKAAFRSYLQKGEHGMSQEERNVLSYERRDLSEGTSDLGGYLVPPSFSNILETATLAFGPVLNEFEKLDTATGSPMAYPTSNDTTNASAILAEGTSVTEADMSIGSVTFNSYLVNTGLVKVSRQLMNDSAFNLESYITKQFAIRDARGLTALTTNGTGTNQHQGILVGATAGPTATGSSKNTGGSETGGVSIGTSDIQALIHSVDPSYRLSAKFIMHDTTVEALENVLDKYGRPVFIPNPQSGRLESLFGYPIVIDQSMPTIAVNAKTILFGDLTKHVLRRVKDYIVIRLNERYADTLQVGFIGYSRSDSKLLDAGTHPVKYLVQAAS